MIELAREATGRREAKGEPVTYYRVSKLLGVTSAYMSRLREGTSIMSADMAHKLARLAEIDPAYAMACIEAERATRDESETSGTWRALAESLSGKAASILLAACLGVAGVHDARASVNAGFSDPAPRGGNAEDCILSQIKRRRRNFLGRPLMPGRVPRALLAIA